MPSGNRVGVIGGSGGAAAMFSDQADLCALELPAYSPGTLAALQASLPPLSVLRNPVDYTAGYPRAQDGLDFERAFRAVIDDPQVDQMAVMFAAAGRGQVAYGAGVLARVAASSAKPLVVFSGMDRSLAPEGLETLLQAGIPVLPSAKRVAVAMAKLVAFARARQAAAGGTDAGYVAVRPADVPSAAAGPLDEVQGRRLLREWGIPVVEDRLLPLEPAEADCTGLPWPVALKVVSPDIAHKSDIGGVRLGIGDDAALAAAARAMLDRAREAAPEARIDGLLACPMVDGGLEAIVGVVDDETFGPVVALGLGGVFAETLHDVALRIAPFDRDEAMAMVAELRGASLFDGRRGRPAADRAALADALVKVSALAWELRGRLRELDINPLVVRDEGAGVVSVDALVVLQAR
jgi:acetyltransferase